MLPTTPNTFRTFVTAIDQRLKDAYRVRRVKGYYYVSMLVAIVGRIYETSFKEKDDEDIDPITYHTFSTSAIKRQRDFPKTMRAILDRVSNLAGDRQHKLVSFRVARFTGLWKSHHG